MEIGSYHFGRITIDKRDYDKDVVLVPPDVIAPWWRQQGHRLGVADLQSVFAYKPETLVIGTGAYGAMEVTEETKRELRDAAVQIEVLPTPAACDRFNALVAEGRRVAAALHLTC